jgi:anti-sigma B factor antagonist
MAGVSQGSEFLLCTGRCRIRTRLTGTTGSLGRSACQREGRMFNVDLSIGGHSGRTVVALHGELDLADAPAVASRLIAAVAVCGPSIIVDLAGLEFIDCCGLGVLMRVLKLSRAVGGDLYLAAPQRCVSTVLSAAGIIDVFSIYPSVEQAVSAAGLARPLSAVAS